MAKQKIADMTGQRFGRLVVVERLENDKHHCTIWRCRCDCGNETNVRGITLRGGHTQSCGCLRNEVVAARMWKGGRVVRKNGKRAGYVRVYDPQHPNSDGTYVTEHVKVMSEMLGRPLKDGETVHHKNGVRGDNRRENLELRRHYHPPGQAAEDIVTYAIELLNDYRLFLTDEQRKTLCEL